MQGTSSHVKAKLQQLLVRQCQRQAILWIRVFKENCPRRNRLYPPRQQMIHSDSVAENAVNLQAFHLVRQELAVFVMLLPHSLLTTHVQQPRRNLSKRQLYRWPLNQIPISSNVLSATKWHMFLSELLGRAVTAALTRH